MGTPAAKRQAVAHLVASHEMSERRACRVIGCCRMTMRYEVVRQDDPVLRERLKDLAKARRRFGYRRLHVFLRREGHEVNHKRLFRIYREEQLHVRRRGGRKRAMGTRAPMVLPLMPNQRWSLDFVSDQLTDGRRFRIMTVVDDCTRECLALIADTSLSGARVARELATLFQARGRPGTVVSDHGTEFTSNAILAFADDRKINWHYIAPGKSTQNALPLRATPPVPIRNANKVTRPIPRSRPASPYDNKLSIHLEGVLAALLRLSLGSKSNQGPGSESQAFDKIGELMLVAGVGFEPTTFRL